MSKFFVEENQISENRINIIGQDVNHIKNVLRYKVGDVINICSSSTAKNYECSILDLGKDVIECQIIKTIDFTTESNVKITIFQGLPKADKMELIIQKCTELGAIEFVPWNSKRSIVKLQEKDVSKKISRWQAIAEASSKQSGRDSIPMVSNIISINDLIERVNEFDLIFVAYENEHSTTLKQVLKSIDKKDSLKVGFVVGPEGGLEPSEIELLANAGVQAITLGKRILRTETAPIAITSIINYELENTNE